MKKLMLVAVVLAFSSTAAWSEFDCSTLKNKDEKMACLKDLRLLEDKYTKKSDACAKFDTPKTQDQYKLCAAIETKKDPCYGYKRYGGTQEGSDYERCFVGKEEVKAISNSKREAKPVEPMESTPSRSTSSQTQSK